MDIEFFEQAHADGWIAEDALQSVKVCEEARPLSVRRELLILLYFGILLLTTGLGILIYKNIDSIGHITVILLVAALSLGSFAYCFRKAHKPSFQKVESPNVWFNYVLLLGSLLLLVLVGYLQFQYSLFGTHWGLATFIPFVILFLSAYYFDHLGVLSLAVTNLAAWLGISVNFMQLPSRNMFGSTQLIYSGIFLGLLLLLLAFVSGRKNIKAHFAFTYRNFGVHFLFVSLLAGMFFFSHYYMLWFLGVAGAAAGLFVQARQNASFYFLLVSVLYFYVAISYVVVRLLAAMADHGEAMGIIYLGLIYFIASGIGLIIFLMKMNKKVRRHDSIQ